MSTLRYYYNYLGLLFGLRELVHLADQVVRPGLGLGDLHCEHPPFCLVLPLTPVHFLQACP